VPFAALVDEHAEYLAKRFEISYPTCGRNLLRVAAAPPSHGSAAVQGA
jgi:CHAT domain-containing protein